MAICGEQLMEYSKALTRKNKLPSDKGPNFPAPPTMGGSADGSSWAERAAQFKSQGAPPPNPSLGGAVSQRLMEEAARAA
eukprot:11707372-Karenia_brevis.AAC.1